jgi:hypothetical protein
VEAIVDEQPSVVRDPSPLGGLLLQTGERLFTQLVPYLILFASGLLAVQEPVRRWVQRRSERHG